MVACTHTHTNYSNRYGWEVVSEPGSKRALECLLILYYCLCIIIIYTHQSKLALARLANTFSCLFVRIWLESNFSLFFWSNSRVGKREAESEKLGGGKLFQHFPSFLLPVVSSTPPTDRRLSPKFTHFLTHCVVWRELFTFLISFPIMEFFFTSLWSRASPLITQLIAHSFITDRFTFLFPHVWQFSSSSSSIYSLGWGKNREKSKSIDIRKKKKK